MKTLAFIPARGGSVRLPQKNVRLFNGKPLIWYSIAYARFHQADKIVVSTDSPLVTDICRDLDVEVIARPPALSDSFSPTHAAAKHALEQVMSEGFIPDVFVTLQPTNPLRPESLFREAMKIYTDKTPDAVISVTLNSNKFGEVSMDGQYNPVNYRQGSRTQDLGPLYYENGLIYLSKPSNILEEDFFGKNVQVVITDRLYGMMDIDEELDFEIAEFAFNKYESLFKYLD